jgi:hypothetical protein
MLVLPFLHHNHCVFKFSLMRVVLPPLTLTMLF